MDFGTTITGITAVLAIFIGIPSVVTFFIYKITKSMKEKDKIKYQKEILELEIEKQKNQIKLLEEENKKYDNIINNP
jgi:cell shape-determining protein MreC